MGPYKHVSLSIFLRNKSCSREDLLIIFHQLLQKINQSVFWWNWSKCHITYPIVCTGEFNLSITDVFFSIYKHNDPVQSWQQKLIVCYLILCWYLSFQNFIFLMSYVYMSVFYNNFFDIFIHCFLNVFCKSVCQWM